MLPQTKSKKKECVACVGRAPRAAEVTVVFLYCMIAFKRTQSCRAARRKSQLHLKLTGAATEETKLTAEYPAKDGTEPSAHRADKLWVEQRVAS